MAGTDWPFTRLGMSFFEGTLPNLVRQLARIADALEEANRLKKGEDNNEPNK